MAKKPLHLKPQDVVLLLKLLAQPEAHERILDLAHSLGISSSEISHGLSRLRDAALLAPDKRSPLRANALEFLVHGLKYVFPAKLDAIKRGVPTAHSALPLSKKIKSASEDKYVWPSAEGKVRGQAIIPLYPSVPEAALKDPELHELLALCDAIRIGRAREKKIAVDELNKRLVDKNEA